MGSANGTRVTAEGFPGEPDEVRPLVRSVPARVHCDVLICGSLISILQSFLLTYSHETASADFKVHPRLECALRVHFHSGTSSRQVVFWVVAQVLNPKKKVFEAVQPDLLTSEDLVACYRGQPLKTAEGVCTVRSIAGGTIR